MAVRVVLKSAKPVKIGAKVVSHGRHATFQSADVAVPRNLSREILRRIDELRPRPVPVVAEEIHGQVKTMREVRLGDGKYGQMAFQSRADLQ